MSKYADLHLYVETESIDPNVGYNEPDSYIQHVSEGGFFNHPEHGSGSWYQHVTGGNQIFDANAADHKIEVASPDQGDVNTHVGNSDTEPKISSYESDEEPANDEQENMNEGTSSRHVQGDTLQ
ncbi:hypothetical protein F511_08396 [Dorcoceras hygrometricum]|uniref:Uncharacterized protein n=1 Tax=Dorcoceras hygrometricum TaxID=472368 RepID=A0A2Z7B593_9LAMI|nr:hypothetical protein F511_08396 [Dorcoceras hygrometricum]